MLSTAILILRSLWPFVKEVVFKDKNIKEFVSANKLPIFLTGCLLFIFALFGYSANLADRHFDDITELKSQIVTKDAEIASLKAQLTTTATPPLATAAPPVVATPVVSKPVVVTTETPTATTAPAHTMPKTKAATKQQVSNYLKSYVESSLEKLD